MNLIVVQFNLFLLALQFYSRIPVGRTDYSEENLSRALRFFPLVGWITGAIGGAVFMLCILTFPQAVAVTAALIAMVAVTGALHEDGLSDFFDGFGGGYSKERIMEIMKDSRVGVYGVISLIFLFLIKFSLLLSIDAGHLPLILIAAHASSRFAPAVMMRVSSYVRTEKSKSTHSRNQPTPATLTIALLFAVLPFLFIPWQISLSAVAIYTIIFFLLKKYTEKKIGGFTGDVLGTLQQFCETAFYLVYVGFISYT